MRIVAPLKELCSNSREQCVGEDLSLIHISLNAFGKSVFGYNVFTLVLSNHLSVKAHGIICVLRGLPGKNMWKVDDNV